jgi:hypothetical protein
MNFNSLMCFAFLTVSALLSTGCVGGPIIKGTGPLKSETRNVANFTEVDMGISGKLTIKQGAVFSVVVKAQENIVGLIKTELDGKSLEINFGNKYVESSEPITVEITMPAVNELELSGSGLIDVVDIFSPEVLKLELSGSGKIGGQFITKKIETEISGSGKITLSGSTDYLSNEISGSGVLDANKLDAKEVKLEVAGSGQAEVSVRETLRVDIAGSGNVVYQGNPGKIEQNIAGSGRVTKR